MHTVGKQGARHNIYQFQKAKAIWRKYTEESYNQFVGFHTYLSTKSQESVTIAIAARSYYRLYLNGKMISHGPARTAEHFCRVDEIPIILTGDDHLAIEVAAYSKPEKYCNDCTMEPGMLIAEVIDERGNSISATGQTDWTCKQLPYRRSLVETMSHCRGIVEYYDLALDSFLWRIGQLPEQPVVVEEGITYLKRRAPYAAYESSRMPELHMIYDMQPAKAVDPDKNSVLAKLVNSKWYSLIPKENYFLEDLMMEKEASFSGKYVINTGKDKKPHLQIVPGEFPAAVLWKMPESEVGFLSFSVCVSESCVIDILHSDHLEETGELKSNTYATRYSLQPGEYDLTLFEPKLIQYVKFIMRTQGKVKLTCPRVLQYTYPDNRRSYFQCDDGDLNRIYEAARKSGCQKNGEQSMNYHSS